MSQRAERQKADDGGYMLVYEGFLTGLFGEMKLATPYYTKVLRHMKAMRSIRQLSRGGGAAMSRWELLEEPTLEAFQQAAETLETGRTQPTSRMSVQEQMIVDLQNRVDDLEEWREAINQAIANGGLGG